MDKDDKVGKVVFIVLCLLAWGLYYLHDAGILGSALKMFGKFFSTHLSQGGVVLAFYTITLGVLIFSDNEDIKGIAGIILVLVTIGFAVYYKGWLGLITVAALPLVFLAALGLYGLYELYLTKKDEKNKIEKWRERMRGKKLNKRDK